MHAYRHERTPGTDYRQLRSADSARPAAGSVMGQMSCIAAVRVPEDVVCHRADPAGHIRRDLPGDRAAGRRGLACVHAECAAWEEP